MTPPSALVLGAPDWLGQVVDWDARYRSDEERMRVAVELARQNVLRGTGGPFGAGVFEEAGGRLVAAGVNSVTRLNNSVLHAETLAIMLAQARLGTYALGAAGVDPCLLVTSCEPCAMCLGAILWSGVRGLICGATKEDATAVGFDEGPVFAESWVYLERRGVRTVRGVLRGEAVAVLELYRASGGEIYSS
ncbi:MAG TPA: nucleoside deaminase [Gemmatimonadales bacterium]|nr:nucleoside deaminase [Gemmatimonadales bacterium]